MTKKPRGLNKKTNPKYLLNPKCLDDPTQRVIICIHELQDTIPQWEEMEKYIKGHTRNVKTGKFEYWKWNERVGGRRAIFAIMEDNNKRIQDMVWHQAEERGVRVFKGVAYPSLALKQEAEQILQKIPAIDRLSYNNLGPPPYVYIFNEQKGPIYVGQTTTFLPEIRIFGHPGNTGFCITCIIVSQQIVPCFLLGYFPMKIVDLLLYKGNLLLI